MACTSLNWRRSAPSASETVAGQKSEVRSQNEDPSDKLCGRGCWTFLRRGCWILASESLTAKRAGLRATEAPAAGET
jgi:hypothetical protein